MTRKAVWIGIGVAAAVLILVPVLTPDTVAVTTAEALVGPMTVTVDEDGRTRAVDRYVVTAPVAGELERLPIRAGERVNRGDAVARIRPLPLDERTRSQLAAALDAAQARERAAATAFERADAAATQAEREVERRRTLLEVGALSAEALEQYVLAARSAVEQRDGARQARNVAQADVRAARAALLGGTRPADGTAGSPAAITVRAPASGTVAAVPERSSRVIQPGEVILEITDPSALEVVVDVLSTDAARIEPGMRTELTGWGGPALGATVRRVEPAAFTRLSALGVEEQRVNVILDLDQRPNALGDGYRVEASVAVWRADSVLSVPASAVFRNGAGWRVFRVSDRRARLTTVTVGERTGARAQILAGLSPGDEVILFPADDLQDGTRVDAERIDEGRASPDGSLVPSDTAPGVRR
ncbi:MAG TPA: efflux RND transporter periplasmic adaptor subunit [Gemmatimonadaceae bacterium]|nr:efflux RND transporter periplasmic adaptor subunit [Gemmatimonadaceae bacterium]